MIMIYIYLKTHNKTKLKYLGKTTKDPFLYKGSGKYWLRHLAKHGDDISTKILFQSPNKDKIREKGLELSKEYNIVKSLEFANLREESGDGGDTSQCKNYINSLTSRDLSGHNNPMYGRSAVTENKLRWYNDGYKNIYVPENTNPNGFNPGRIIDYKKPHTLETKEKLSKIGGKACVSPEGKVYNSLKDAAIDCNVSSNAIAGRISRGKSGWRFLND